MSDGAVQTCLARPRGGAKISYAASATPIRATHEIPAGRVSEVFARHYKQPYPSFSVAKASKPLGAIAVTNIDGLLVFAVAVIAAMCLRVHAGQLLVLPRY